VTADDLCVLCLFECCVTAGSYVCFCLLCDKCGFVSVFVCLFVCVLRDS
jgi:hypothetical protein